MKPTIFVAYISRDFELCTPFNLQILNQTIVELGYDLRLIGDIFDSSVVTSELAEKAKLKEAILVVLSPRAELNMMSLANISSKMGEIDSRAPMIIAVSNTWPLAMQNIRPLGYVSSVDKDGIRNALADAERLLTTDRSTVSTSEETVVALDQPASLTRDDLIQELLDRMGNDNVTTSWFKQVTNHPSSAAICGPDAMLEEGIIWKIIEVICSATVSFIQAEKQKDNIRQLNLQLGLTMVTALLAIASDWEFDVHESIEIQDFPLAFGAEEFRLIIEYNPVDSRLESNILPERSIFLFEQPNYD